MFVAWGAAAKETEHLAASVPDLMFFTRWDRDRIANFYIALLRLDANATGAVSDVINFLREPVVMFLRGAARMDASFGETLVANRGIAMGEKFTDF